MVRTVDLVPQYTALHVVTNVNATLYLVRLPDLHNDLLP